MGRVKVQIKKIENTTNRQVTFSKRRNGLMKKAYELSVLCDVDVALVMFSPSGRVSTFSGTKSIEEIMERYLNLPEHERGRLQNQEYLMRALGKSRYEAERAYQVPSPPSVESPFEDLQQEIIRYKNQLEDLEKRLRLYEGDTSEITTMCEADFREQLLEETLRQVRVRKVSLPSHVPSIDDYPQENSSNVVFNWLQQRDPQAQIPSFNSMLPLRDQTEQTNNILQQPLTFLNAPEVQLSDQMSPRIKMEESQGHHRPDFGQVIDVNLSSWTDLYPTDDPFPEAQPRERAILDLFLSQLNPINQDPL